MRKSLPEISDSPVRLFTQRIIRERKEKGSWTGYYRKAEPRVIRQSNKYFKISGKLYFHSFASSIKQNYSNKNDHHKRYKKFVKKDNFVIFTNITFFYHLTICVSSISITMKLHHIEIIYRSTVLNYVSNKKLENKPYMFVFETCSRLCFAVRTSCCSLSPRPVAPSRSGACLSSPRKLLSEPSSPPSARSSSKPRRQRQIEQH